MDYVFPDYINQQNLGHEPIDYVWDDSQVEENLDFHYGEQVTEKLATVSLRARLLLMNGIYEWILARLINYTEHKDIFENIAQAAYCANINPYYLAGDFELDRDDFEGPVDGVLWCAGYAGLTGHYHIAYNSYLKNDENYTFESYSPSDALDECSLLITLALHILPQDRRLFFKQWLEENINQLQKNYKLKEIDPFKFLFTEPDELIWFGDYVSREILVLGSQYSNKELIDFCDRFLQQVDYHHNPLLVPPKELKKRIKHPYRLTDI
ncbi:hypothetical protein [Serratia silvae]|uniref:Uncharacterized protein n=1 Tax=Serratia silvae TaxID=2824122 RepID=A0ABT0KAV5_9GAMM|nr:hypothetical protein [Serratia silvae]MCL1029175.1 hypothetical protein [Serratia silvae]